MPVAIVTVPLVVLLSEPPVILNVPVPSDAALFNSKRPSFNVTPPLKPVKLSEVDVVPDPIVGLLSVSVVPLMVTVVPTSIPAPTIVLPLVKPAGTVDSVIVVAPELNAADGVAAAPASA